MRSYLLLIALLFWLLPSQSVSSCPQTCGDRVVTVAKGYIGVTETGSNRGKEVEFFQKNVGIPPGSSWCAAFVSTVLDIAEVIIPDIRSGVAQKFITRNSISAKHVAKGYETVEPGWLVIWKRGNTWKGHIGINKQWDRQGGTVIEGNTSSNIAGSQFNGDGVYEKYRKIYPNKYFRITHFTPVQCAY